MSSKRCRVVRSSSRGEVSLYTQIQPLEAPATSLWEKKRPAPKSSQKPPKDSKPPIKKQEQHLVQEPSILTLGETTLDPNEMGESKKIIEHGFGEFLKGCSFCKKILTEHHDVFMYGYLGAFCSAECRGNQIALDGLKKEVSSGSRKMATEQNLLTGDALRLFRMQGLTQEIPKWSD
ncbi:Protein of unknown function (DUF581) [Quillaja saponaria]|uniref:FLZ-type domain-containing protein n=1 Tax=Quillaja saponaria TaxID=32244 RepID=A0AAD7VCK0_QUISA|nr:Protein of unknown function (DUF581) [Quillaja saponaria]